MIIQNYQANVALLSLPLMIQVFLTLSLSFHRHHCIEYQKPLAMIFGIIVPNKSTKAYDTITEEEICFATGL
jgi:hypothetical protein